MNHLMRNMIIFDNTNVLLCRLTNMFWNRIKKNIMYNLYYIIHTTDLGNACMVHTLVLIHTYM